MRGGQADRLVWRMRAALDLIGSVVSVDRKEVTATGTLAAEHWIWVRSESFSSARGCWSL